MKVENRGLITGNSPVNTGLWNFNGWFRILGVLFFVCLLLSDCQAVGSKTTRHKSSEDFLTGKIKDVVVGSQGTLQLGRSATALVEKFGDVWSINSIVVSGGDVFVGTSPNGGIYKYSLGVLTKIYPAQTDEDKNAGQSSKHVKDVNEPNDANAVKVEQYLTNEHIFAMTSDVAGRLLAGISGKKCRLMRLESGKMNTIFEPNNARYIFAITVGETAIFIWVQGRTARCTGSILSTPPRRRLSTHAAITIYFRWRLEKMVSFMPAATPEELSIK